ncbi:uncharacterized protein LOC111319935 [Stylophora pistillata]|uniref:uncharacterized protein LOC111319935 n=1 Tax=Stylophora pistillata TaxID=50429 RepID=UPI000C044ADE|nr:uncharacterized protein LOC111319935 [Stylophora pistillata]
MNLTVVYGSVRQERQGDRVARLIERSLIQKGHKVRFIDPVECDLPLLNKRYVDYEDQDRPEILERLAKMFQESDGFVIVSGEGIKGVIMTQTPEIFEKLQKQINENNVVLYMKGSKSMPMCGFSGLVAQVLARLDVEDYLDVDVLRDPEVRQGIKDFTNWPTIPQLYVKGEFIGGADIVREMYESGELEQLLSA